MNSRTDRRSGDKGGALLSAARRNPEGLLLLAAGAALLFRHAYQEPMNRGAGRRHRRPQDETGRSGRWVDTGPITETMEEARRYAADVGEGARRYASDLGSQISETTSAYAASASRYASDMGQTVAARSERLYEDTTSTLNDTTQRILRDQPLMVALAGFAAGAALAAVFPRTELEERTLGPVGERMTDFASEQAQAIKEAGREAGQQLKASAQERGFSPDGMKEMAHEASDAFASKLRGDTRSAGQAGSEAPDQDRTT